MKSAIGLAVVLLASTTARAEEPTPGPLAQVAAANRGATLQPQASAFLHAAQIYPFAEGAIYQVYAAPGSVTDVVLQAGEALIAVASGDTARWVIGDTTSGSGPDKRTHILVKPFSAGLLTNLVITTDRRTYHVRLTSTANTALSSLRWTYPQDEMLAAKRAAEAAEAVKPVADTFDLERLNFGYVLSGDRPDWRPLRAFDDGRQTFIEMPAAMGQGEAPPLFLIGAEGQAELVNYRVRGRYYVVDRIFAVAELRLGLKKQQVVRITRAAAGARRRA